jgi:thiamine-monophosphate kinase
MLLKQIGEFGFIQRIRNGCLIRPQGVVRAIGDDAAAIAPEPGRLTLVTTDLLVERIHFLTDAVTGEELGHKALAVNLSDIAAMGGTAREAFVSLAIPERYPVEFLDGIYRGMKTLAALYGVNILGGDTTGAKEDLVICITVVGSVAPERILTRAGAQVGDAVCVTGALGDSRAGLHLILNNIPVESEMAALRRAHVRPEPQLREGRLLADSSAVTAAIDISDGLSSDVGHIAEESKVGVRLFADKLPLSEELGLFCRRYGFDPVSWALAGGEDYCLLCTVAPSLLESLAGAFRESFGRPLIVIGEIAEAGVAEVVFPDGRRVFLEAGGWDHFSSDGGPHL